MVDRDTQILTRDGWKYFGGLEIEDSVLTLRPDRVLEFQTPSRITKSWHGGEVTTLKSESIDLILGNKIFPRDNGKRVIRWQYSEGDEAVLVQGGQWINLLAGDMSADWYTLLGVWLAHGGEVSGQQATFYALNLPECLVDVLTRSQGDIRPRSDAWRTGSKRVFTLHPDLVPFAFECRRYLKQTIPTHQLFRLNFAQLEALYRGITCLATDKGLSVDIGMADGLDALAVLTNRGSWWERDGTDVKWKPLFPGTISGTFGTQQNFEGVIYSCHTLNGNIYVRRQGKSCWIGG